ncbi:MAG: DUF1614 domain-containing protein [Myxococcota bacterium]
MVVLLGLALLFPLLLANVVLAALAKLGLSPGISFLAAGGIFLGGVVNIPIRRIPRDELIEVAPLGLFGFDRMVPRLVRRRTYTLIAVNLGGCVVPCAIAAYELGRIAAEGAGPVLAVTVAIAINTGVCWWLARPVPGVGIAMPALIPAVVAAICGLTFVRELAPPIAFVAGVLGPLLGADLLHLSDVKRMSTGVASIGGAGTFDGIVLSGLVATLLA